MKPETFGAYTLLRRIAVGGTAEIFLARRHGVDGFARHLAIKRILGHHAADPEFVQLLLDEARLAAHLHHGHIVEIHEVGLEAERAYIAMEYLPGVDVGRLLAAAGKRRRTALVVLPDPVARAGIIAALGAQVDVRAAGSLAEADGLGGGPVDLAVVDGALLGPIRDPFLHRLQSAHPELLRTILLGEPDGRGQGPHVLVAPDASPEAVGDLAARLLAPQVPLEIAVQIVRAVADGLAYAHQARDFDGRPLNIVHRDVNPSNVLVSVNGSVKLVDFGIARATTTRRDEHGAFIGTFHSMSPEQARGKPVDARSDLFSLGTLLYELVTGRHPFRRDDQFATLRAVREESPPLLGDLVPGVPTALAEIACRALAKDPQSRYADAGALLADLEDLIRVEGFNLSPRRLEGLLRVVFSPEELLDLGVTTTGTLPRVVLPASFREEPAAPAAPAPRPAPAVAPQDVEIDVDVSDLAPAAPSPADHPLERLRGAPSGGRSDGVAYKVALALVVLAALAAAFWYLHARTVRPLPGDAQISSGTMRTPG